MIWSVIGASSGETKFDPPDLLESKLKVAFDETAGTLTVRATASADQNRFAELAVMVTDALAPLVTGFA